MMLVDEVQIIRHLTEQQAKLAKAINLVQGSAQLVRQRQPFFAILVTKG